MSAPWKRASSLGMVITLLVLVACQSPISPTEVAPAEVAPTEVVATEAAPTTADQVPRITVRHLKARLDAGVDVIVVDARSFESYREGHIAGAILMPLSEVAARYSELPRTREIVLYCA